MEDIMAAPGLDNLHIIEAGPIPANPSELLSTTAMAEFLRAVAAEYDIVLIDTPPVLPVTDSAIVAGQVDGVLLVYQAGKVGRLVLKRAKAHLESTRAKVWGVVLNDVQTEVSGYNYTHYYTHYYGEETPSAREGGALSRLWERVRSRVGRSRASTAVAEDATAGVEAPAVGRVIMLTREEDDVSGRRPRYKNLWIGLLVLAGLLGVLAGLAAWQMGLLGAAGRPLDQLRQRLGIGPAAPAPARAPAPRATTPAPAAKPPASTPPAAPSVAVAAPPPSAPPAAATPATVPRPAAVAAPPAPPAAPRAPAAAAPAPSTTGTPEPARTPPPASRALAAATTPAAAARFAIEFGPLLTTAEAERIERQLTQAGYPTVRFRQTQTGVGLYAVLLERLPAGRDPQAVAASLREQGLGDPTVIRQDPPAIRLAEPLPLRGAVELAERARALGHSVRVAAQPGEAVAYMIRHGNFASRLEAEAKAEEFGRLGLPHQVIQVR
jgi:hypothetical protein